MGMSILGIPLRIARPTAKLPEPFRRAFSQEGTEICFAFRMYQWQEKHRARGDFIKKGGWGNVIAMRSLTTRIPVWSFAATGNGEGYETDRQDQNCQKYLNYIGLETVDRAVIDRLIREIGDDPFYRFADIPFFGFA